VLSVYAHYGMLMFDLFDPGQYLRATTQQ
jgi:hypothetical protein